MNDLNYPVTPETGLRFFGQITASVSHEIKNCLAIMNENAGLLQDLLMLSRRGKPLDPERLDRIASQINDQIQRADTVVKNLNRFAHSTDDPVKSLDLNEALSLTIALNHRLAANRGVTLKLAAPEESCLLTVNPFVFQYLISRCLDLVIAIAGSGKQVDVRLQCRQDARIVAFVLDSGVSDPEPVTGFQDQFGGLLERLNCRLEYNEARFEVRLVFRPTEGK